MRWRFWRRPPRSYRDAVLATNPAAHWRLGETSGTVAKDEVGANSGTYVNAPTLGVAGLLTGDADTAVTLNGTSQYATIAAMTLGNSFTICAWVKPSVLGSDRCIFNAGRPQGPSLMIDATGHLACDRSAIARVFTSTPTVALGVPSFVVVTKAGTATAMYINGAPVAFAGTDQTFLDATGAGAIGADGGFQPFTGGLDEIAIWNRALAAAEIAYLHRVGMGR